MRKKTRIPMLRSLFILLSKAKWAQDLIMKWSFSWKFASRFIAGITIDEVIQVARTLNQKGLNVTIDHLGENTINLEDTIGATNEIIELLNAINENAVLANVSIKLTQLGLSIDKQVCKNNLDRILEKAQDTNNFIRVDMEDSTLTQQTLELVTEAHSSHPHLGTVLQSYLYRSQQDVSNLLSECIPIRMVKGAYKESSNVAFPRKKDVDANFDKLTEMCLEKVNECRNKIVLTDNRFPPSIAVASHDEERINHVIKVAENNNISKKLFEFQMLYGIRRDLQDYYTEKGYSVRVYVPYGTHWYPYFMRRLAERPANVWFFVSNFFKN